MSQYNTQQQWGGSTAPWQPGGVWTITGEAPAMVGLNVTSSNNGQSFSGVAQFAGQGGIEAQGTNNGNGTYAVQLQWGGSNSPWNPAGNWSFAGNSILNVNVSSPDNGQSFSGVMQMPGEGGIEVRGTLIT